MGKKMDNKDILILLLIGLCIYLFYQNNFLEGYEEMDEEFIDTILERIEEGGKELPDDLIAHLDDQIDQIDNNNNNNK